MNTTRDPKELVIDLLERSVCAVQVAAVLADRHGIFGWGWNNSGNGYGQHAEVHCILRSNKSRAVGATLYVASRRARNGKAVLSMPCDACSAVIRWAEIGKVLYRDQYGMWVQ